MHYRLRRAPGGADRSLGRRPRLCRGTTLFDLFLLWRAERTGQTAIGTGLPARMAINLVWYRGAPRWQVRAGLFNGIKVGETPVVIGHGTSDAGGKVAIPFKVPDDFGYIHTVTLAAGTRTLARQGFTVIPSLSISPGSGPVGTPITVTLRGDGYRLYESVWHLLYDSARTGWLSAITTTARPRQ